MSAKMGAVFALLIMVALVVGVVAQEFNHLNPQTGEFEPNIGNKSVNNNSASSVSAATPGIVIEFYTQFQKETCGDYGCTGRNIPWVRVINEDSEKKIIMIWGEQYALGPNSSVSVPLDWKLAD